MSALIDNDLLIAFLFLIVFVSVLFVFDSVFVSVFASFCVFDTTQLEQVVLQ